MSHSALFIFVSAFNLEAAVHEGAACTATEMIGAREGDISGMSAACLQCAMFAAEGQHASCLQAGSADGAGPIKQKFHVHWQ